MAKDTDKLSDRAIKTARLPAGKNRMKMADGRGLYLMVTVKTKVWRMDYRFAGKRNTLTFGRYPDLSLKGARAMRRDALNKIAMGIDPALEKKAHKQSETGSFEAIAREWFASREKGWKPSHAEAVISRLERNVFPWLGTTPIDQIEPPLLLAVLRRIESRGAIETAHRVKAICGQVFRYGVATGRCQRDPTPDLRGALQPVKPRHYATVTDPKRIGEILRAIDGYQGTFSVRCALQIAPYVFVRPGELRHAEWSEINLDTEEWRIPADKMKMSRPHIVPLARQVVAILEDLYHLTGAGRYLFPSVRTTSRVMSENTVNAAFRRLGFGTDEICGHGLRAMASTTLHEQGFNSDVIERQLAHAERNQVKAAYNHAEHLRERKAMMQHWADYLDGLRQGAQVIPINRKQA